MKMMKIVALLLGVLAAATTAFASVEKLDTTSLETLVAGDEVCAFLRRTLFPAASLWPLLCRKAFDVL